MRLQFLKDCSGKGHFHGVQFFRDSLLQCHSPTGSQDRKLAPAWGPAGTYSSMGFCVGCWMDICSTMKATTCITLVLRCLEHLLPSFFTDLGVYKAISLTSSHSSLTAAAAQKFLLFFEFVIKEEQTASLIVSALTKSMSILELAEFSCA